MVENLLIVKNTMYDNEDGISQKTGTPVLNTDDDESASMDGSQQPSENLSKASKSDLTSEKPQPEKVKKKKPRPSEQKDDHDSKKRISKKRPWYTKIDLAKPIIFLSALLLIYLIWVNRNVLIVRLLTSNARVRHTAIMTEQKQTEKTESPQGSSVKDSSNTVIPSSSTSNDEDEIIGSNNDSVDGNDDDNTNNDQATLTDNDEDSPKVTNKYSASQKLNIRARRNKMSFSKERYKKKGHRLPRQTTDGDDNITDDIGDDDDDDDDDDTLEDAAGKIVIGSNKIKEPNLSSTIHSSKKHHHRHHRSATPHEEDVKTSLSLKNTSTLSSNDDIIAQLKKMVQSRGGRQDLAKVLAKVAGFNQAKINRFINRKDYSLITLDTFMSLLDSFDSTILILSK